MQEQRLFSQRFQQSYPSPHDNIYAIATEFASGSQILYDKFTRDLTDDVTVHLRIQKQVDKYIKEIDQLERKYTKLVSTKSEMDRYQSKLDSMERSTRRVDQSKKNRNLQKLDRNKEGYSVMLATILDQQKNTYAKHPVVFKAALTAYWLNHEKHVSLLVQSLESTQQFAKLHENDMKKLDIDTYTPDLESFLPIRSMQFKPATSLTNTSITLSPSSESVPHVDITPASPPPVIPPVPIVQPAVEPTVQPMESSPTSIQNSYSDTHFAAHTKPMISNTTSAVHSSTPIISYSVSRL